MIMQELLNNSDYEIVMSYNSVLQGVVDCYSLAVNVASRVPSAKQVYKQSLVKTLASKHKKNSYWVYRQYATKYDNRGGLMITVPRERCAVKRRA